MNCLTFLVVIFALPYVVYILGASGLLAASAYWEHARAVRVTAFPNLNGIIVTSVIAVALSVLAIIGYAVFGVASSVFNRLNPADQYSVLASIAIGALVIFGGLMVVGFAVILLALIAWLALTFIKWIFSRD